MSASLSPEMCDYSYTYGRMGCLEYLSSTPSITLICNLYHFFNIFSYLCQDFSGSICVGVHIHNSFEYVSICCGMMISVFAL